MKNNLLLLCTFFCFYSIGYSQEPFIQWGKQVKSDINCDGIIQGQDDELIKYDFENKMYASAGGKKQAEGVTIERYNPSLKLQEKKVYSDATPGVKFTHLLNIKNKLFLFLRKYNRKLGAVDYFCQELDIKSLEKLGGELHLGVFANKGIDEMHFQTSNDTSKLMLFTESSIKPNEKEQYQIMVFDNNMTKLWEKKIKLSSEKRYVDHFAQLITNDGQVGLIVTHSGEKKRKKSSSNANLNYSPQQPKLWLYTNDKNVPYEYILDIKGKIVQELNGICITENNIQISGTYKNNNDDFINGVFSITVDKNQSAIVANTMAEFPQELITAAIKNKEGENENNRSGLSRNFSLYNITQRENGSVDYLFEHHQIECNTVGGSESVATECIDQVKDIFDVNVDTSGANIRFTFIPKIKTEHKNFGYAQFRLAVKGSDLLLFYLDDTDNNKTGDNSYQHTSFGYPSLIMTRIDESGNLSRKVMYNHSELGVITNISNSHCISRDKIVLFTEHSTSSYPIETREMLGLLKIN